MATADPPIGTEFAGYRLEALLGRGGMGVVYLARDPWLERQVALKLIASELAQHAQFRARFLTESRIAASLEHADVVPIYEAGEAAGRLYLAMRHIDGSDLKVLLNERGRLDPGEALAILKRIAVALDAGHAKGLVHCDVKPGNVLLGRQRADGLAPGVYLADFGISSRVESDDRIEPGQLVGTLDYLAPEQIDGSPVSARTDVYALGCVLYHCLTGSAPFHRESRMAILWAHLEDDPPRPGERRPELGHGLDTVIARALAKVPQSRYPSCTALIDAAARSLGLESPRPHRPSRITSTRNPYKGLRPFEETDADEFFGREASIAALLDRLADPVLGRVVSLVGPSGSGKSSLLNAGLVPRVRRSGVPGSRRWSIAQLVPGHDPFDELAAALRSITSPGDVVPDELRNDVTALSRAVERVMPDDQCALLLIIDQFEEIFTMTGDQERGRFLALLTHAVGDPSGRIHLAIALRADFYDRPLGYREFSLLLEAGQVNVYPLSPAELELAITGPAAAAGVDIEPGLVADIIADFAEQPGALPLLQYALTELFERRESNTLTAEAYRRIGGVSGALARRSEQLYADLDLAGMHAARKLFTRLVTLADEGSDSRRRVRREEIEALDGGTGALAGVIDGFGRQRILSFDRDPTTHSPTVEIAHEALLRAWPRLQTWIDHDRDGLRLLRHLSEAAMSWQQLDREPGELYRGARLENALAWASAHPDDLHPREREFLDRARERRDEEQLAERVRAEQRIRQNRRLRLALGVVAFGLVAALIAVTLAARAGKNEADARFAAETGRLIAESSSIVPTNRRVALLLAAEAHRRDPSVASLGALQRALIGSPGFLGYLAQGRGYEQVEFSADGARLVAVSPQTIDSYDLVQARLASRIALPGATDAAAVSAGGGLVAVATGDVIVVYDVVTGGQRGQPLTAPGPVTALAFDPSRHHLASGASDGTVVLWDPSSGGPGLRFAAHPGPIQQVAFSRDGGLLATSARVESGTPDDAMAVRVWDTTTGAKLGSDIDPPRSPAEDENPSVVTAVEFDADGVLIVGGRRAVGRWEVRTGRHLGDVGHPGLSARVDPSQESSLVDVAPLAGSAVAFGTGAKVTIVDVGTGEAVGQPRDSQLAVALGDPTIQNLAVSADASTLAVAGQDGIALWSLDGRQLLARAVPRGDASFALVDADNTRLMANASFGSPPTAWNIAVDPAERMPFTQQSVIGQFGDDGRVLYTKPAFAGNGGVLPLRVWDPRTLAAADVSIPPGEYGTSSDDASGLRREFAVGDDAFVRVYDLDTGRKVAELDDLVSPGRGDGEYVNVVDFSPDGKRLVGTTDRGHAVVWDTSSYESPATPVSADAEPVSFAYYSPDGRYLVTSTTDGTIRLRDPTTHEALGAPLVGHRGSVIPLGAAFTADSSRLITAGLDGQTLLWDVETRTQIGDPWPGGAGGSGSPDGRLIVTLLDEHILMWDTATDRWPAIACRAAGRHLTPDEWSEFGPVSEEYRPTCQ